MNHTDPDTLFALQDAALRIRDRRLLEHTTWAVSRGEHWEITVSDNGIGIDPTQAQTIFQPFQSLHGSKAYSGSGIGLAICSRVIVRHGGEIHVAPGDHGGSVFRFTLPSASTAPEHQPKESS